MSWIKKELHKLDNSITDEKTRVIMSIVFDDMIRNGNCTKDDYIRATQDNNANETYESLRCHVSKVLQITYKMVAGM